MPRKKHKLDYKTLDAMCVIHCTGEECASVLNIDYDTLNAALKRDGKGGFSDYFKLKSATGKRSLRRKQFDKAIDGDNTMMIWLGKQWLGQSDKLEQNIKQESQIQKIEISLIDSDTNKSD